MNALGENFQKNKAVFKTILFSDGEMDVRAEMRGDASGVVNGLLQTGLFEEVKIVSSLEDRRNPGYDLVAFRIKVKKKA